MPQGASYEDQQAELHRLQDDGSSSEMTVEAPKEPEVDPKVYRDIEPYLFRGFLTQSAEINNVHFVFKTLNHHEHELIRLSGGYDDKGQPTKRFWNRFLAYSVLMVDDIIILPDREHWVPKFDLTFREFQTSAKAKILRYLSELNRRASNAVALTECYAMERSSRYRWYQVQGLDMTSAALTGIIGTERLGLNWGQLIWRALNRIEDTKEALEHEWEHAKFIGSCSAGKGIQKVYQRDVERRRTERDEQLSRKDSVLRHVLLGEPLRTNSSLKSGAVWVTARTVEELNEQLKRDLKGDKDLHDTVVSAFENRVKKANDDRYQELQEVKEQRDIEFGGKSLVGGTDMTGLSHTQVQERMTRTRQIEHQMIARRLGAVSVSTPGAVHVPEAHVGTTDEDPSRAPLVPVSHRQPVTPFRRG